MQAYKSIKHFQIVIIESLIRICNSGLNSIQLREGGGGGGGGKSTVIDTVWVLGILLLSQWQVF